LHCRSHNEQEVQNVPHDVCNVNIHASASDADHVHDEHACHSGVADKHASNYIQTCPHEACKLCRKLCRFMQLITDVNPNVPDAWKYENYRYLRRPCPLTPYLSLY